MRKERVKERKEKHHCGEREGARSVRKERVKERKEKHHSSTKQNTRPSTVAEGCR